MGSFRIVPGEHVVGQRAQGLHVAAGGEELEGADADMARRHAGEHRAGQEPLARHVLAGRDRRERPGGGDAERRHRLADEVLAQHRAERRPPVRVARERRRPGALQLDVAAPLAADHLAEQDRPPVPELGHEIAELVPGIGRGERLGALGHAVAGERRDALGAGEPVGIEAEIERQRPVEPDQPRALDGRRREPGVEAGRQAGIAVVEGDRSRHARAESSEAVLRRTDAGASGSRLRDLGPDPATAAGRSAIGFAPAGREPTPCDAS